VFRVVKLRSRSSPASSYSERAHVEKKRKQIAEEGGLSVDHGDASCLLWTGSTEPCWL
jgi:hypothetical protein